MILTEEEWAMVYRAMVLANAIVLDPMTYYADINGEYGALILLKKDSVADVIDARQKLRDTSELPYNWKQLMQKFHEVLITQEDIDRWTK